MKASQTPSASADQLTTLGGALFAANGALQAALTKVSLDQQRAAQKSLHHRLDDAMKEAEKKRKATAEELNNLLEQSRDANQKLETTLKRASTQEREKMETH